MQWVPAYLQGVMWPGLEADHSRPSSADVKNEWVYTPLFLFAFMARGRKTLPFSLYSLKCDGSMHWLRHVMKSWDLWLTKPYWDTALCSYSVILPMIILLRGVLYSHFQELVTIHAWGLDPKSPVCHICLITVTSIKRAKFYVGLLYLFIYQIYRTFLWQHTCY
jgi:hypothetical protein